MSKRKSEAKGENGGTPGNAVPGKAANESASLPVGDLMKNLDTTTEGLGQAEAQSRLSRYGYNELTEEKVNPLLKFLSYFKGPIPGMIIAAAVISGVLHHWPDLGVILGLLFMNAIVGFREEYQADTTIAALKEKLAVEARVKRDGSWTVIPARELVPGDIIPAYRGYHSGGREIT
jgi:H+-transporting ATPase